MQFDAASAAGCFIRFSVGFQMETSTADGEQNVCNWRFPFPVGENPALISAIGSLRNGFYLNLKGFYLMSLTERRRAFLFVEDAEAEFVCTAIDRALENAVVERFESREALLEAVFAATDPAVRPFVVVSQSRVFLETESLISKIRSAPLFLPTIVLRIETVKVEKTAKRPKATMDRHYLDSVFSVFQPFDEQKIGNAISDASYLADDFYRLQRNMVRFDSLSPREVEIVRLATEGVPNKSIARRLNISIKTVEKNRQSAYLKLKISSAAEMATMVTFHRYCWASPTLTPRVGAS